MREIPPPVFSRRSFLFFIVLAPACLLAVAGIVLTLQYKQFQALVNSESIVAPLPTDSLTLSRADSLVESLNTFAAGAGSDSMALTVQNLNDLAAASPVLATTQIRLRVGIKDSFMLVESARRVDALSGRLAWIFKRIAPIRNGWLNATMEGLPELKTRQLSFVPERGFMNGAKVPRAAMTKRAGMSPKDFIDPNQESTYKALIAALDTVYWDGRAVVLVRQAKAP
jgi:hypothetical protein